MWGSAPSAVAARQGGAVNYGIAADVGMVGLRDVLLVAPAATFHHTQHHHHLHHHHHESPSAAAALLAASPVSEHGLIPLLSAAPCLVDPDSQDPSARAPKPSPAAAGAGGIQFWQPQHLHATPPPQYPYPNPSPSGPATISYLKKQVPMLPGAGIFGASVSGSGGGTATCQDCGNQAKKECSHGRCRTCCKSRGFECSTHVKSTWVPAARRRERQHLVAAAAGSSASTSAAKKPRLISSQTTTTSHTSTSNTTPPRSFDTSSSHQDASFRESLPRQVRAPAVFKCVRVTSIDDGGDEYAYQAVVSIAGHVFKGFLYDVGVDDGRSHDAHHAGADTSHSSDDQPGSGIPNISELHLGGAGTGGRRDGGVSSSAMLPSDVYGGVGGGTPPPSGAGFLGGAGFGNPMS